MGLLSRFFSKKDEEPAVVKAANDSVPAATSTPPDDDIFPVPEAIRQFMIEQHGFDPMKNPLRPSVVCPEAYAESLKKRRASEEALKNPQPGQKMPDGTIYLGRYSPIDRNGKSLRKTFNVFAAPEDLPEIMTYNDTVKYIAKLEKWHGYEGTNYTNDTELYAAIKSGSYNGGWIIPTRDILHGKDVDGKDTTPDNILAHKDRGALNGTFKIAAMRNACLAFRYLSSTEFQDGTSYVYCVSFSPDDFGGWTHKDGFDLSCRPVRLVEIKP